MFVAGRLVADCISQLALERAPGDLLHAAARANSPAAGPDSESVNRHVSESYELFMVRTGRARLLTPDGVLHLRPGHLAVVDPGVEHEEVPEASGGPYELSCFAIDRTLAQLFRVSYLSSREPLVEIQVDLVGSEEVESIAAAVAAELAHRAPGWETAVRHLLRYLEQVLRRRLESGSFTYRTGSDVRDPSAWPRLEAAVFFCHANLSHPLRLPDIASRFGYSPRHLSRLFAKHAGKPFSEHVRELRMNVAAELLTTSDLSVAEIADHVGYPDPSHFTRAFRAVTGLSPRAYRRSGASS